MRTLPGWSRWLLVLLAVLGLWAGPNNSVPGRLLATLLGQGAVNGRVAVTDPLLLWAGGDDFIDADGRGFCHPTALQIVVSEAYAMRKA
jgi:UDP-glucose 4-epimerase